MMNLIISADIRIVKGKLLRCVKRFEISTGNKIY
jgi:hypothetical protein